MTTPELDAAIKSSKAPAIARAVAVLRLLGKAETPLGLQAIARELGLVPSTCLYVLRTLTEEKLVAFDPATKRYRLDAGILTLARHYLRSDRFVDLAQAPLDRISARFGLTTLGVQVSGLDYIIALAVSQSEGNFSLNTRVGTRFPALISATGRCIAAFGGHEPAFLRHRFDQLRWDDPPSFQEWLGEVAETRANGYALDAGRYISGVYVVAAPVSAGDVAPTHALVALGLESRVRAAGPDRLGDALAQEAATLSVRLAGSLSPS